MYLAQYLDNKLIALSEVSQQYHGEIDKSWIKISKEQYNELLEEIIKKSKLVDEAVEGKITIEQIPTEWQAEIVERVETRKKREEALTSPEREISAEEAQKIMIEGV